MQKISLHNYAEEPLSKEVMLHVLKDYKRPYDKISELIRQKVLISVKNGLYIPGINAGISGPDQFLLANHLWGPSYVSLESALSYWGLIPEYVYETTSVTTSISKTLTTEAGRYSFMHLPLPYYSLGIRREKLSERQHILIASPEKALCDKLITTSGILLRSKKETQQLLIEDLRLDEILLKEMNTAAIETWIPYSPKKTTLTQLIKTMRLL